MYTAMKCFIDALQIGQSASTLSQPEAAFMAESCCIVSLHALLP